jgi:hypothetical protein
MDGRPTVKTCFKCKQAKETSLFFKHHQTSDGFHSWCKECCKQGNARARAKKDATIEGKAVTFYRNAIKSAEKRKQECSITLEDVISCWYEQKGYCAYTGRKMTLQAGQLNTVSIERIDSNIGYTKENTILVCQAINRMKSNFNYDDFYDLCRDVVEFLGDEKLKLAVGAYK